MWSQSNIPGIEEFTIDYEQLKKDCVDPNIKLLQIDDQKELVNYETVKGYYYHPHMYNSSKSFKEYKLNFSKLLCHRITTRKWVT